jgi:hypothetical protein
MLIYCHLVSAGYHLPFLAQTPPPETVEQPDYDDGYLLLGIARRRVVVGEGK